MLDVSIDTPTAIVLVMVLGAVFLVFWASRPSVIARYAVQKPVDAAVQDAPAPSPSAIPESKPSA